MSLGRWFRDYLYIPLGGNRVSKLRFLFIIYVVWMASGFWHGAAWNFILWGLFFAVFLIIEKLFLLKFLKKAKFFNHIYVLFLTLVSFILFDNTSLKSAVYYIGGLFGAGNIDFVNSETLYYLLSYAVLLFVAVIGCTPLPKLCYSKVGKTSVGKNVYCIIEPLLILGILVICTAFLIDGSFNPFLYFRF